jgi:monoamine oxidase
MTLSRRSILSRTLAGLAAFGVASPAHAKMAGKSVAVIGAGMAGLAAAGALARAGADVTIYEARARIGGRVVTSTVWRDLPCDLGASWIHGPTGNPIKKLAKAAGAATVRTSYESSAAFAGAEEVDNDIDSDDWTEAARKSAAQAPADMSLKEALIALRVMKVKTAADIEVLAANVHLAIEHEYGGDWGSLSARYFDMGEEFAGEDVLFPQGYGALATYAANGLTIKTGAAVTRLTPSDKGVKIDFEGGQSIRADAAIVTLPLGVLQSGRVAFNQPLARKRQAAIDTLGMGLLNKVFLRFDKKLDIPAVDWFEKLDAPRKLFPEWVNLAHVLGAPALLGFNAAASADDLERASDKETVSAANDALRAMFGSRFPAPVASQITRWRADPLALGSYSYHAVGAAKSARNDLAGSDWDGRIVFAGEACSADHPSTVHGAWMSGLEAAREV